MFIDLLSTDNSISCNVKAAKLLGLETAIYLNELININAKAISKNKLDDNGFFRLKRSYVADRTTIPISRQLELDTNLLDVEILSRDENDVDLMKIDVEMYASILTNQNKVISNKVEKLITKKSKAEKDLDKKNAIISNLKMSVKCTNDELRQAYYNWIDSVYEKPGGFLSKGAIEIFENDINKYAKGDLDVALDLLQIATSKSYKNVEWVVKFYENTHIKNTNRTTTNRDDSVVELSEVKY